MTGKWEMEKRHLYLCTPDREDVVQFVEECVRGGVDVVQLRDKHANAREIVERARMLAGVCGDLGVPLLMNDRPDLALECGADGVHVGQEDVSARVARQILGQDAVIGLSTHAPADVDASATEPIDYISAGPVVPTPTKPGRPGTGTGYVAFAVDASSLPVFVTGGVSPETIPEIAATGARHFVVVRYLTEADDPARSARLLRDAVDRALDQN